MSKKILLIQGHPDASQKHLGHALADSYALGAEGGGHQVRRITLAELEIPPLRSQHDWEEGELPASLKPAQDDIGWAEHIIFSSLCGWVTCPPWSKVFWNKWRGLALPSSAKKAVNHGAKKA